MKNLVLLVLLAIFLNSCNAIYHAEYNPYYYTYNSLDKHKYLKTDRVNTYDLNDNNLQFFKDAGYTVIGFNNFNSTPSALFMSQENAKMKGANVILYSQQYLGTQSGNYNFAKLNKGQTYYVNQQSSSKTNIDGYSNSMGISDSGYGFVNSQLYGTASTVTNTSTTITAPDYYTYHSVPYSNDIYSHRVVYLVHPERRKIKKEVKNYLSDLVGGYKVAKVETYNKAGEQWNLTNTEYPNAEIFLADKMIYFRKNSQSWKHRELKYKTSKKGTYFFDSQYGETRILKDFSIVSFYDPDGNTKYFYYIESYQPNLVMNF